MATTVEAKVSTGIEGLDEILDGGLPQGEAYVVEGEPGTGKTLLAAQFLRAGADAGERCLFISLCQSRSDLERSLRGAGVPLAGVEVYTGSTPEWFHAIDEEQVIFSTGRVELGEMTRRLIEEVDRVQPQRVVFDGVGFIRMLAGCPFQYRQQLLALRAYFGERDITVLLTNDETVVPGDGELRSLVYGVISLSHAATDFGNERRRLRITKLRGAAYEPGVHDYRIARGGLRVFPRLGTLEARPVSDGEEIRSGIPELDELLGGGLLQGTSCLFVGPSGTGKTSVSTLYACAAAAAGQPAAIFLFDELEHTFLRRSEGLGMPARRYVDSGLLRIHEIKTAQFSPGEFINQVREEVHERRAGVILLDTLTGYISAMPDERLLVTQMHDLLSYLSRHGVLTLLVVAQHGVVGPEVRGPVDVSYLADSVVMLRHFESRGSMRQAISVFKKRYGRHEKTIRELRLEEGAIRVGRSMDEFEGVLSGVPKLNGRLPRLEGHGEPSQM